MRAENNLVYWSLALPEGEPRPDLIRQFDLSTWSFRHHSPTFPAVLFVFGTMWPEIERICAARGVMVHHQGRYEAHLASHCPKGWAALARYPTLHRFFDLDVIVSSGTRRALYVDCDTVFFRDVQELFDRYDHADVVAREEVHTRRSVYGPDRDFLDEELLSAIARDEHAASIDPFNLGVILFNHDAAARVASAVPELIDIVWRFVTWMADHPVGPNAAYGEFRGLDEARTAIDDRDRSRALVYPSANRWILDEVACWLALGRLPGLTTADFHATDVAQNGETLGGIGAEPWVLCHYFSNNLDRVVDWLGRRALGAA